MNSDKMWMFKFLLSNSLLLLYSPSTCIFEQWWIKATYYRKHCQLLPYFSALFTPSMWSTPGNLDSYWLDIGRKLNLVSCKLPLPTKKGSCATNKFFFGKNDCELLWENEILFLIFFIKSPPLESFLQVHHCRLNKLNSTSFEYFIHPCE